MGYVEVQSNITHAPPPIVLLAVLFKLAAAARPAVGTRLAAVRAKANILKAL